MAKRLTQLRVFVASPEDLAAERDLLEEVVKDLNLSLCPNLELQLELVRWETHSFPSIGGDPQSIISTQIGDDYDIFVGILWKRFGTETPRAGSGTVEEFDRAYARLCKCPESIRMLMYFKDEAVPPSQIDIAQLNRVKEFQARIADKGLYSTFSTSDDFKRHVRLHLSKHIQEWGRSWGRAETQIEGAKPESQQNSTPTLKSDEQDEGWLDLIEKGNAGAAMIACVVGDMTAILGTYNSDLERRVEEMAALRSSGQEVSPERAKQIVNRAAMDMNSFADRTEAQIVLFAKHFRVFADAYIRSVEIGAVFAAGDGGQSLRAAHHAVGELANAMQTGQGSLQGLKRTVGDLPPMTRESNRAKRRVVSVLETLDGELTSARSMCSELMDAMQQQIAALPPAPSVGEPGDGGDKPEAKG